MIKSLPFLALLCFAASSANAYADDMADIQASIQAYVHAFNSGNAVAIAEMWSDTGEWINPDGQRIVGSQAIESEMEDYFSQGGAQIEVIQPKIRLLAPTVAMEEGQVRVTRPDSGPSMSTYIAIHVKVEGRWKLESVRETAVPTAPSNYEHLRELEWMIGTWVDEDDAARIETKCEWTKNRNFITRSFALEVDGKIDLEGTQVIGYDAANKQIRSWIFDSAGGFGSSIWRPDGNDWIIKNAQTLQDGSRASSINIIRYIDDNTCTWESHGRELDGELQPSIAPVNVVRVTDQPSSDAESPNDWNPIHPDISGQDGSSNSNSNDNQE